MRIGSRIGHSITLELERRPSLDATDRDEPGVGSTLTFELDFDQTDLPRMIEDLDDMLEGLAVHDDE